MPMGAKIKEATNRSPPVEQCFDHHVLDLRPDVLDVVLQQSLGVEVGPERLQTPLK